MTDYYRAGRSCANNNSVRIGGGNWSSLNGLATFGQIVAWRAGRMDKGSGCGSWENLMRGFWRCMIIAAADG